MAGAWPESRTSRRNPIQSNRSTQHRPTVNTTINHEPQNQANHPTPPDRADPKTNPPLGPNRKSDTEPGTSPPNGHGMRYQRKATNSPATSKPRNSNDSHRPSPPRTTRIWQAPGLNREPAGDIRYSPTAPPNTDQLPTPPSTETAGTKPIPLHPSTARPPKPTRHTDQT